MRRKRKNVNREWRKPMKGRSRLWIIGIPVLIILWLLHMPAVQSGALATGDSWLFGLYVKLLAAGLAGAAAVGFLFFEKCRGHEWKLSQIYPAAGLFLGLLYMTVLPPLSAPDEISHYISAYQLSSHMLGQPSNSEDGHVLVRVQDWMIEDVYGVAPVQEKDYLTRQESSDESRWPTLLGQVLTEDTYKVIYGSDLDVDAWMDRLAESLSQQGGDGTLSEYAVSPYPPVVTTPLVYVPQAVGIALARLLNRDSLWLLYLGRLMNLLFFVAITWLAMKRLPFGKEVLFGVALLPMTLHLSASFSYDVMILACMFLFTAVCLDLAYEKEKVEVRDILLLAVLMGVAGPCKMVYGVLMGLCLLIPVKKFGGWGKWLLSAMAVAGVWVIAMVLVNGRVVADYAAVTDALVSGTEEAGFSLRLLLHRPGLLMQIFSNTIVHQMDEYHLTMIGSNLGNLDPVLYVPYQAVLLYTAGLLLLAFRKPGESLRIVGGRRVWVIVVCVVCGAALMLSMLISCTPQTSTVIEGVQGRYFLPFLPVLLMTCKNDWLVLTKNRNRSILYVMCCMNLYVVFRLFSVVCTRL